MKDAKVAKYLLDNGLDPNAKDTFNRAPLFFAHDGEIVKLLLEYGANIESRDNNDVTVMFSGSWNKKPDAKLAMIAAGANLNLKNREGRSLLYTVHEPVVYKELLVKGLNVNDKDKFGMTPLHYVCKEHWGEKQTLLTELLIAYGADVNAMDDSGMMPLDYAKGNNTKNLLISNAAKTTRPNESGLNS